MAPRIARAAVRPADPDSGGRSDRAVAELCRKIAENCDYVGDRFAEEARKIHYGERKPRSIYGSGQTEAGELRDEGVEFHRVPWVPRQS